jgi:hypothetical protein
VSKPRFVQLTATANKWEAGAEAVNVGPCGKCGKHATLTLCCNVSRCAPCHDAHIRSVLALMGAYAKKKEKAS